MRDILGCVQGICKGLLKKNILVMKKINVTNTKYMALSVPKRPKNDWWNICIRIETCDDGAFCSIDGDVGYLIHQTSYTYALSCHR